MFIYKIQVRLDALMMMMMSKMMMRRRKIFRMMMVVILMKMRRRSWVCSVALSDDHCFSPR